MYLTFLPPLPGITITFPFILSDITPRRIENDKFYKVNLDYSWMEDVEIIYMRVVFFSLSSLCSPLLTSSNLTLSNQPTNQPPRFPISCLPQIYPSTLPSTLYPLCTSICRILTAQPNTPQNRNKPSFQTPLIYNPLPLPSSSF